MSGEEEWRDALYFDGHKVISLPFKVFDHINGPSNHPSNLRWISKSENIQKIKK